MTALKWNRSLAVVRLVFGPRSEIALIVVQKILSIASALYYDLQSESSRTKSVLAGYCPMGPLLLNERPEHLHPVLASAAKAKRAIGSRDFKAKKDMAVSCDERN